MKVRLETQAIKNASFILCTCLRYSFTFFKRSFSIYSETQARLNEQTEIIHLRCEKVENYCCRFKYSSF